MSTIFESLPASVSQKELRVLELALVARIQKGDEAAANELVMLNLREAMLYTRFVARNMDDGALLSLCYETLMKNTARFDPSRQRFFAFSKPRLRGALYRNYNKEQLPLMKSESAFLPTGPKKSACIATDGSPDHGMKDYEPIADANVVQPDLDGVITRDHWELVKPVMEQKCSEQEKMVLTLTYVSGLNFQEVGDLLSVTRSAIQRTHWRAIKKLRIELSRRKQLFS